MGALKMDLQRSATVSNGSARQTVLSGLLSINTSLHQACSLQTILERILETAMVLTGGERGFVMMLEEDQLRFAAGRGVDQELMLSSEFALSRSLAAEVIATGQPILTTDGARDQRLTSDSAAAPRTHRAIACAPMLVSGEAVGCIYTEGGEEVSYDHSMLLRFAEQAGISVRNWRLTDENRRLAEHLTSAVTQTEARLKEARSTMEQRTAEVQLKYQYDRIIYKSAKMQSILKLVDRLTDSDLPVLICGESGTGKELLAKALHYNGARKSANFVGVNCGAIPENLFESEFFGYVKGAFTGADRDKKGFFEIANNGTLFLDEVGELPMNMQVKLLRVLQEGEIRPVGAERRIPVDVRVVGATNRNLQVEMSKGRFREDLFYRLGVVTITLPPLRERPEDIPALVDHFLESRKPKEAMVPLTVHRKIMKVLQDYHWPGNIRELENVMAYLSIFAKEGEIKIFPPFAQSGDQRFDESKYFQIPVGIPMEDAIQVAIKKTLEHTGGNKSKAAKLLMIDRVTFYRKLKTLK